MRLTKPQAALIVRFAGRGLLLLGAVLAAGWEAFGLAIFVFLYRGPGSFVNPLLVGFTLMGLGAVCEYVSSRMTPRRRVTLPPR